MKTKRVKEKIKNYLKDGEKSIIEIHDFINRVWKYGVTMNGLGNILAWDKEIIKVGYIKRASICSGSYKVTLWALKTN